MKPLKDWQHTRLYDPVKASLLSNKVAICGGCTGSGKSYIGAHLLAELQPKNPVFVCPKITHTSISNLVPKGTVVINIEKLRTGNTPYARRLGQQFIWNHDIDMVIIDEAHQCRGSKDKVTLNCTLAQATRQRILRNKVPHTVEIPLVLMTATLAESPLHLRHLGGRIGLHKDTNVGAWLMQHGCFLREIHKKYKNKQGQEKIRKQFFYDFPKYPASVPHLQKLLNELYPKYGGFITTDEIPGFPESELRAELYDINPKDVKGIREAYEEIQAKHDHASEVVVLRLHARQMAELSKVEVFATLVENAIEEGSSAVVFLNFIATREALAKRLEKHNPCMIYGLQNDRDTQKYRFMTDQTHVAIVMAKAGGTGLDELSDAHIPFARPRVSFISPMDSATEFLQCCGRLIRMNTVHKVFQTIVLAAGTEEEEVKKNLDNKLSNLNTLTDEDLLI